MIIYWGIILLGGMMLHSYLLCKYWLKLDLLMALSHAFLRVHKNFKRNGVTWKSGQRIKILKGACAGFHRTNTFATLEFIILEGWEGDVGGDARIICRPLGVPTEDGCQLSVDKGSANIDLRGSKSLPFSVIVSKKCIPVNDAESESRLQKHHHETTPSSIEVLDANHSLDLDVSEAFQSNAAYSIDDINEIREQWAKYFFSQCV